MGWVIGVIIWLLFVAFIFLFIHGAGGGQTPAFPEPETMNLYFINETDYVAAFNEESAIQFYETEFDIVEEIDEIPKTEWGNMTITIIDDPDEGVNDEPLKTTFSEWMEQFSERELPLIVASNDY